MTTNREYLAELEKAIRPRYRCSANHRDTVFVHEKTAQNETVWIGDVEVFDLTGCKEAGRCYAWQCLVFGVRIVTMLHTRLVDSAHRAVQAAIFSGGQSAMFALTAGPEIIRQRIEQARIALYDAHSKTEDLDGMTQAAQQMAVSTQVIQGTNAALDEARSQISTLQAEGQATTDSASEEYRVHIFGAHKTKPKI